jgi:hypothetical protein
MPPEHLRAIADKNARISMNTTVDHRLANRYAACGLEPSG